MPLPSKGRRKLYGFRVRTEVDVDVLAHRRGYDSTSQFVADLIYQLAERPDLVEGPAPRRTEYSPDECLPGMTAKEIAAASSAA